MDAGDDIGDDTEYGDATTWLLIAGDRRLVAGGLVLSTLLVLLAAVRLGIIAVGPESSIRTLLSSGITSGLLALITVSLSINQLLLSRVFGSPGELEDRLSETIALRERIEEVGELPVSPNHPVSFLGVHGTLLTDRAATLASVGNVDDDVEDGGDNDGDDEIVAFCGLLETYGEHLEGFSDDEPGTFDALAAILGSEYADLLQQDLAQLSQVVAYSGFVALVTTYLLTLVYHASSGATLSAGVLEWIAPLGLAVTVVPLAFLISYILRVATISRYTVSVGTFVPPEDRFER